MREFRKKQKKLYKFMKSLIIFGAVFIFIYIGAQPYVQKASTAAAIVCGYVCDLLVIVNLCVIFSYYNKYGKSDRFLEVTEHEISDYGSYITSREKGDSASFISEMLCDFKNDGYAVTTDTEIDEFDFSIVAFKKKEFFYVADIQSLSRDDIIAYIDVVINDITVHNLKRSGNCVLCFVTDKAQENAVALSKMITPLGKKEQITIALAVVEPAEQKCYFLGNMETKCRAMIAEYVMHCKLPFSEKHIGDSHLPFQDELEERMRKFDIKQFKNGSFYAH